MIELLKNIGSGLWYIGIVCAIAYVFILLGWLLMEYTVIMVPILVVCVAWAIGKFMRS